MRILVYLHEHFAKCRNSQGASKIEKFVCMENELEGALFLVMP
jgi:hypothetical protein